MSPSSIQIETLHDGLPRSVAVQLARLHREEISGGFLSSLGERFLTDLYSALGSSPDVILVIARRDENVLGFLCGAVSPGKVYRRFLMRNSWRVAPTLLRQALSLQTLKRMGETLAYPAVSRTKAKPHRPDAGRGFTFRNETKRQSSQSESRSAVQLPDPEILNFCVSSHAQRCGIGRRLFHAFCSELAQRGIPAVRIVTGAEQHSAQRFYESVGAVLVRETEIHAGQTSLVYVHFLADDAASEPGVIDSEQRVSNRTSRTVLQPLQHESKS